jgi:hypothetical protein
MTLEEQTDEPPTVDADPDVRLLLLWNRFQPSTHNCRAPLGAQRLKELRSVLAGY